ncbi:hemagglutinin repeat-containing protein [Pelagibacterium halotolerans]|uniref:two-partner secretion domain-containing protein n=1 Tax=Pelagibacterium halotolerans TaxID=531813 RepID=UPI00384B6BC9
MTMTPSLIPSRSHIGRLSRATIAVVTSASFVFQSVAPAFAQALTVAPGSGNGTEVSQAANGVPVVNIAGPNAGGLSQNVFSDFNVGSSGLVLNNSTELGQSVLGGVVLGNGNLGGTPAKIILNEVTSTNPSTLGGAMEVFGSSAAVVVANPNGITCDGCGFINTPRATLTTGTPVLEGDQLTGFEVTGGTVTIGAGGADARSTDYFDIVSRAAVLNGAVHGQDVGVFAGQNDFDYAARQITAVRPSDGSPAPAVAIDSSALGGMYANRIRLESTEAGVGVNAPAGLVAGMGGMRISADGRLVVGSASSQGTINATSHSDAVRMTGVVHAGGDLGVLAGGGIDLDGSVLGAFGDIALGGSAISLSDASVISGVDSSGKRHDGVGRITLTADRAFAADADSTILAGDAVTVNASTITHDGRTVAGGDVAMNARSGFTGGDGQVLSAGGNAALNAGGAMALNGTVRADARLAIEGDTIENDANLSANTLTLSSEGLMTLGGISLAGSTLSMESGDALTLAGTARAGETATLAAQSVRLAQDARLSAGGAVTLEAQGALDIGTGALAAAGVASDGTVGTEGALRLAGATIAARDARLIAAGDLTLSAADALTLQGGAATAGGRLDIAAGALTNSAALASAGDLAIAADSMANSGAIEVAGNLSVSSRAALDQSGTLRANGDVTLDAGSTLGQSGTIEALGDMSLTSGAALAHSGTLRGNGDIAIDADGALGQSGTIEAAGNLSLSGSTAVTHSGTTRADGNVAINAGDMLDTSGAIEAAGNLSLSSLEAIAQSGTVRANGSVTLDAGSTLGQSGTIEALGNVALSSGAALAHSGTLRGNGDVTLDTDGALGQSGTIVAAGGLSLSSDAAITHSGTARANGDVAIHAGDALDTSGAIEAAGNLSASSLGAITQSGTMRANGNLTLDAGSTLHQSGAVEALGNIALASATLTDHSGTLRGNGDVAIDAGGALAQSGDIAAAGDLSLSSSAAITHSGTTRANGNVALDAGGALDQSGEIAAAGNLAVSSIEAITQSGAMRANGNVALDAGDALDQSGTIEALGNISLSSDAALDHSGTLRGNSNVAIDAGGAFGQSGTIAAAGDLSLSSSAAITHSGTARANGNVALDAGGALDQSGEIAAAGSLSVSSVETIAQSGTMRANGTVAVDAEGRLDQSGTIEALGDISLSSGAVLAHTGTTRGNGTITLDADGALSQSGDIEALGDLSLSSGATITQSGAMHANGAATVAATGALIQSGTMEALGGLSLSSGAALTQSGTLRANGNIALDTGAALGQSGTIEGGGGVAITALGGMTNAAGARVVSGADLTVSAQSLQNDGAFGAGRDLGLSISGNIGNTDLLVAKRHMGIALDGTLNNTGTIFAAHDLSIAGLAHARAAAVINENALIEANQGNLSIATNSLVNRTTGITFETNYESAVEEDRVKGTCGRTSGFGPLLCDETTTTTQTETWTDGTSGTVNAARILSGGNMVLSGGAIENTYSLIAANGNLALSGTSLTNTAHDLVEKTRVTTDVTDLRWVCTSWFFVCTHKSPIVTHSPTEVTTATATIGSVHATIQAGGTLSGNFTGRIDNTTIREGGQVGLSSGVGVAGPNAASGSGTGATAATGVGSAATAVTGTGASATAVAGTGSSATAVEGAGAGATAATVNFGSGVGGTVSVPGAPSIDLTNVLGGSSLTQTTPDPQSPYLVETRPEFIDVSNFYNSDYFFSSMPDYRPDQFLKRLGDAYVETRLIQDQIFALTGRRLLDGYGADTAQIAALYDNALGVATELNLSTGVTLSAEQVAALTDDIVWPEWREVDGVRVLVPRVYLASGSRNARGGAAIVGGNVLLASSSLANSGVIASEGLTGLVVADGLDNIGGLIGGTVVDLNVGGTLANLSGEIAGTNVTIDAGALVNQTLVTRDEFAGGFVDRANAQAAITALGNLDIGVAGDVAVLGGTLKAGGDLSLDAGGDVTVAANQLESSSATRFAGGSASSYTLTNQLAGISAGGDLAVSSGGDMAFEGAELTAGGDAALTATGDLTIASVQDVAQSQMEASFGSAGLFNTRIEMSESARTETSVGSNLDAFGDLSVTAGGDMAVTGSTLAAGDTLAVTTGGDLTVAGQLDSDESSQSSGSSGFLYSESSAQSTLDQTYNGSLLIAGRDARLDIGGDAAINGSTVTTGNDLDITATNVTLGTGQTFDSQSASSASSGLFFELGNGGFGFGFRDNEDTVNQSATTSIASALSAGGDLSVAADENVTSEGAYLGARDDLRLLAGEDISLEAITDTWQSDESHRQTEFGIRIGASETVSGNITTLAQLPQNLNAGQGSGLNKAVTAASAALEAIDAANALQNGNLASVEASIGFSHEASSSSQSISVANGGTLSAGGNITLDAGHDITTEGTRIEAGEDINLHAGNDITLGAAQNTASSSTSTSSAGFGLSASVGMGLHGPSASIGVNASAQGSNGADQSLSHTNTQIVAGGGVSIVSGNDTTLSGAQVAGETVTADIGGDLTIESLQDTSSSNSSASGGSIGLTLDPLSGGVGGSLSLNGSTGNGTSAWVAEQSGIFAGDAVDITVGGNTDLVGGAIVSESDALTLDTGTLTVSDLSDHDTAESVEGGLSLSGGLNQPGTPGWSVEGSASGHDKEQETRATIGEGEIVIRDTDAQEALEDAGVTETVANINRDPDLAQEITKDEESYIGLYASDTSVAAAVEAGGAVVEAIEQHFAQYAADNQLSPDEQTAMLALAEYYDDPSVLNQLGACVAGQQAHSGFDPFALIVPRAYAASVCTVSLPSGDVIALSSELVVTCQQTFDDVGVFVKGTLSRAAGPLAGVVAYFASTEPLGGAGQDTTYQLPDGTTLHVSGYANDLSLGVTITDPDGVAVRVHMMESGDGYVLTGASIQGQPVSTAFLPAFSADLGRLTGKPVVVSQNANGNNNLPTHPQQDQDQNRQGGNDPEGGGPDPWRALELLELLNGQGGQSDGHGNIGGGNVSPDQALDAAERWLGADYREIAPGVYRSADGTRQFRMTSGDLTDLRQGAHVHFESIGADGRLIVENSHVGIISP